MSFPLSRRLAAAALLLAAGSASAGVCSVTATSLAFGRYQPLTFASKLVSTDVTSDATVSVACTGIVTGGAYSITLGPSTAGNSVVPRYLGHVGAAGPDMVFNVFLDASYTTVWGDGFAGTAITGTIPTGDSSRTHTVFGRIPAGQNTLHAGNYSGSMTVTIRYEP